MIATLLTGPFLTRSEASARCGIDPATLATRPDVLRLPGRHLEETYFSFQFDRCGLRPEIAVVVAALSPAWDPLVIADWLVRPNASLSALTPLAWLEAGRDAVAVLEATCDVRAHATPAVPAAVAEALNQPQHRSRRSRRAGPVAGPVPAT